MIWPYKGQEIIVTGRERHRPTDAHRLAGRYVTMMAKTAQGKRFRRGMLRFLVVLGASLFAACSGAKTADPFPEDSTWFNVSQPLTWSALEGRVVLLDFFSPGCINCIHMLPIEKKLAEHFGKQLVIIGVDSPKFTNSGTRQGLKNFITQHDIRHPILLDADMEYWRSWDVFAWPTFIVVGPKSKTTARLVGERSFEELANAIKAALEAAPPASTLEPLPLQMMAMGGGTLESPGGIAFNGKIVAISDTGHNRIVLANRHGEIQSIIGGCGQDHHFYRPHGLDFHAGNLYVADTQGQRVAVIDLQNLQVKTLVGTGKRSRVLYGRFDALKAKLNSPWDVQWAQGKLYISMAGNHQIWRFSPKSQTVSTWAGSGSEDLADGMRKLARFAQPSGLDAHEGTLYVADAESSSIRTIDLSLGQVQTLIGEGLFKFGFKNGPAEDALLQHPEDVVWLNGSLYIADTFNNAIRRLDLETQTVSTVTTGLAHPEALTALDANTLLVAESGANRIVTVSLPDGEIKPWPLQDIEAPVCHSSKAPDGQ